MSRSLQPLHTFRLPSSCAQLQQIKSIEQLSHTVTTPYFILGEGANTLFLQDYQGCILQNQLQGVVVYDHQDSYKVQVASGENWHGLITSLHDLGIHGLENLALIPGSVGGAVVQNIGAYGIELCHYIETVEGVDLSTQQAFVWSANDCQFGYRWSRFKEAAYSSYFITRTTLSLPKQWVPVLSYGVLKALQLEGLEPSQQALLLMQEVMRTRQSKLPDPEVIPNAGSFFKNPIVTQKQADCLLQRYPSMPCYAVTPSVVTQDTQEQGAQEQTQQVKLAAGWLIEQTGLKSVRIGGAGVHKQQALVLINQEQATGEDVIQLVQYIRCRVLDLFHILLEPEVILMGGHGILELPFPLSENALSEHLIPPPLSQKKEFL